MSPNAELEVWVKIFDRDSVIENHYCKEVILPHVRIFLGTIRADYVFMHNNARSHWTLAIQELMKILDITQMNWLMYFPDLNPIEHAWDALGRHRVAQLYPLQNTQKLKQILIQEWTQLLQELLDNLVLSMENRCEETIAVREGISNIKELLPVFQTIICNDTMSSIKCFWFDPMLYALY